MNYFSVATLSRHSYCKQRDCRNCRANQQTHSVRKSKYNRVFIQFSTGSQKPYTAEPENHERHNKPKHRWSMVECHHIPAADVDSEDDDRCIGTGSSKTANLFNICKQITAATLRMRSAGAKVLKFRESLDNSQ